MSLRFNDVTVSNGARKWCVSGYAVKGTVYLTRIEGDVTDTPALQEAVRRYIIPRAARFARADVYV